MQDSDPLRYSGIAGGVATAKLICQVIFFCTLFVGRPFWIMFSAPFGGGYGTPMLFCAGATGWFWPPMGGGGGAPCAISPGAGVFPNAGIGACCLICTMPSLSFWNSRQSLSMWLAFFLPSCLSMYKWMVHGPESLSNAEGPLSRKFPLRY